MVLAEFGAKQWWKLTEKEHIMGYRQVFTLPPISPWSTDPFNDAVYELAAATGQTPATIKGAAALTWWSDPFISLFTGTGLWQWNIKFNFESETGIERDLYQIGSAGNAAISVGGPVSSPAPIFTTNPFVSTNVFQKKSTLSPISAMQFGMGIMSPGNNAGNYRPIIRPESPTLLQDIVTTVTGVCGATAQSWKYFADPQTGSTIVNGVVTPLGSGLWQVRGTGWMAYGQANIFCIAQTGAFGVASNGGPAGRAQPASWSWSTITFSQEKGLIVL